jgi:hypothetical protein
MGEQEKLVRKPGLAFTFSFLPDLTDHHNHLALASAVKLAKKDSLPATEQKFSLVKGNRNG